MIKCLGTKYYRILFFLKTALCGWTFVIFSLFIYALSSGIQQILKDELILAMIILF